MIFIRNLFGQFCKIKTVMKFLLFFLLYAFLFVDVVAQSSYTEAMQQGDDAFKKGQYKTAINKYFAAEAFDPGKKDVVKEKVNRAFDAIEALRKKADESFRIAKKQALEITMQQQQVSLALEVALKAKAKAEKFMAAFDFYDNKYALVLAKHPIQDEKYSFIDKEGNVVFQNRYEKAEDFDEHGFAKVQIWEGKYGECCNALFNYLMDTTGKKYGVAYKLDSITWYVKALDFRKNKLDSFPIQQIPNLLQMELVLLRDSISQIPKGIGKLTVLQSLYVNNAYLQELTAETGQLTNLQTLNLFGNRLKVLPPEILQLKNLQSLNLGANLLTSLPKGIGQLKKLKTLILSGNNIPQTGIEEIKNLLPACKIYTN